MSRDLSFMAVNKYLSVVNISSGFFTLNGDVVCWFGGGGVITQVGFGEVRYMQNGTPGSFQLLGFWEQVKLSFCW